MDFDKPKVYGDTSITDGFVSENINKMNYPSLSLSADEIVRALSGTNAISFAKKGNSC